MLDFVLVLEAWEKKKIILKLQDQIYTKYKPSVKTVTCSFYNNNRTKVTLK